jgi:hypothetical protein
VVQVHLGQPGTQVSLSTMPLAVVHPERRRGQATGVSSAHTSEKPWMSSPTVSREPTVHVWFWRICMDLLLDG